MKTMMAKVFFVILLSSSNAMYGQYHSLAELKKMPLLVVKREYTDLSERTKTKIWVDLLKVNAQWNEQIEEIIRTFWELNDKVEYITVNNDDNIHSSEHNPYLKSKQEHLEMHLMITNLGSSSGDPTWRIEFNIDGYGKGEGKGIANFNQIIDASPTPLELVHTVRAAQIGIMDGAANKLPYGKDWASNALKVATSYSKINNHLLKAKTLLLLSSSLESGLGKSTIKSSYPNAFEIVDLEKLKQILFSKDTKYAYAFPMEGRSHLVYDIETGRILGFAAWGQGKMMTGNELNDFVISEKSLKNYYSSK